jgi:dephospho-CoA kinase
MAMLVTGPQAAGKSTVAALLARTFERGVAIEGDVFRRFVVSGRAEMTADASAEALEQLRLRYRLARETARAFEDAGFEVVVEDVVAGMLLEEIAPWYERVVVLFPSEEAVRARRQEFVEWVYRLFADATPRIGEWVDSSSLTPEATAAAILPA